MWEVFIESNLYPTYICELIAALAGVFYLSRSKSKRKEDWLLVYYLIFIFIFDMSAISYALYGYVYEFKHVEFIRSTPFKTHFWIYNILSLITTTAYTIYFYLQLRSVLWKKIILGLTGVFNITSIISYFTWGVFFEATSPYAYIFGAFLISFSIVIYYLEIIQSDRILNFKDELAIYISIGVIIYKLSITPLFIFQSYVQVSEDFRLTFNWVLKAANIFMYSIFVLGFIRNSFNSRRKYKLTI